VDEIDAVDIGVKRLVDVVCIGRKMNVRQIPLEVVVVAFDAGGVVDERTAAAADDGSSLHPLLHLSLTEYAGHDKDCSWNGTAWCDSNPC